jgi:hypothetical protein
VGECVTHLVQPNLLLFWLLGLNQITVIELERIMTDVVLASGGTGFAAKYLTKKQK